MKSAEQFCYFVVYLGNIKPISMKLFYKFFMALLPVFITLGSFPQNSLERKIINPYGFPFIETWDQGNFVNNEWVLIPANSNWTINPNIGNPSPSADFTSDLVQTDYSFSLETPLLYSWFNTCAKTWCDFDYKLVNLNNTGKEKLYLDLFTEGEWKNMISFSNEEDKDWTHIHLCLTEANDTPIKIRFRAEGTNSADIIHWYVDNIKIYVTYNPPANLAVQEIADRQVKLSWKAPECGSENPGTYWIHWDNGTNYSAVGTCPMCCIDIAARWDTSQIKELDGGAVTKIAFFACSSGQATYRVRVYQGPDADSLFISQPVPSVILDDWNIVELTNPVAIDVTQDLWIGCNTEIISGWTMAVDDGPAIDGYGNMIRLPWPNTSWTTLIELAGMNFNYNWNIEAYIEPVKGKVVNRQVIRQSPCDNSGILSLRPGPGERKLRTPPSATVAASSSLQGYNIYRSEDDKITYNKVNASLISDTNYIDTVPAYQGYFYKVSAIFQNFESTIRESDPSNIVCAYFLNVNDNLASDCISIHPNPARENIIITGDFPVSGIELFNYTGQPVFAKQYLNEKTVVVNISALAPGLYLFRITMGKEISIARITIAR